MVAGHFTFSHPREESNLYLTCPVPEPSNRRQAQSSPDCLGVPQITSGKPTKGHGDLLGASLTINSQGKCFPSLAGLKFPSPIGINKVATAKRTFTQTNGRTQETSVSMGWKLPTPAQRLGATAKWISLWIHWIKWISTSTWDLNKAWEALFVPQRQGRIPPGDMLG